MSWAVATVVPTLSLSASRDLRRLDVETLAPRHRVNRWAPPRSMFPGYLFVRPVLSWSVVLRVRGVLGVLGLDSGRACLVREHEMQRIFDAMDEDGVVTDAEQPDPFSVGAAVRSRLLDWLGAITEVVSPDHYRVDCRAMGRVIRVDASRADLVLA